jgi:hypothetical protein
MSNSIQAEFILKLFAGKEHNEERVPELAKVCNRNRDAAPKRRENE